MSAVWKDLGFSPYQICTLKIFGQKFLDQKQIYVAREILCLKNFGFKNLKFKIWVHQNFGSIKILSPKKFWTKMLGPKKLCVYKIWSQNFVKNTFWT